MRLRINALICAYLLLVAPAFIACGDDDESDNNDQNQSANTEPTDNDGDNNDDNTVTGETSQFPLEGAYEVVSHTTSDDCDADGEAASDTTGSYFKVEGFAMHGELDYMFHFCDTADADITDCEPWGYFISLDEEEHESDDLSPGVFYETAYIDSREEGGGQCHLEGTSSEAEMTTDGLIVRRMENELEFSTDDEDWDCASGSNADPDAMANMECMTIEILEGTAID